MKNIRFNKKRIASLLVAMGISLCSHNGIAEIISYNTKATLKDGREAKIYFTTGNTDNDYAYVSFDNVVGYMPLTNINMPYLQYNNDYCELNQDLIIKAESANIYQIPDMNQSIVSTLHQNDLVHVVAKNINGWYVIASNGLYGFIHESAFVETKKQIKVVKITGNKVNVRSSATTSNKNNIIGSVNSGDTFKYISHEGNWYLIDYNGYHAYVSDDYGIEMTIDDKQVNNTNSSNINQITMAKITGNNVNIRLSTSTKNDDNIIGFADITDYFNIIDKQGDWYIIDYLGQSAYVNSKYVKEALVNEEDTKIIKMVYLTTPSYFYKEINGNYMSILPEGQYASVIKEEHGYYKVRIDGVIGYINKRNTKDLTNTFTVSDLGRQICRVFKNNKEVFRAHIISGRQSMPTDLGVYKIGHKMRNYQLTADNFVEYWMQYNGNEGYHDASWQKASYFKEVAQKAYEKYMKGRATTYPDSHGSHGCNNLKTEDAAILYQLLNVGDNVLVIGPNNLVRDHLISENKDLRYQYNAFIKEENQKVKKLV